MARGVAGRAIHAQGRTLGFLSVLLYLCSLAEVSTVFCYPIESIRQPSAADIYKVPGNVLCPCKITSHLCPQDTDGSLALHGHLHM